jgi:hypothetical protein
MTRESDIEKYLVSRAQALGAEVRKLRWIGQRGAPDRIIMSPALGVLFVDVKAPEQHLRPNQRREIHKLREAGQRVEVVDSFERVDEVLG